MSTRYVALQDFVGVLRDGLLSDLDQSKRIAAIARQHIQEVEHRQGVFPRKTVVDGVEGRVEEAVRPDGTIIYYIYVYELAASGIWEEIKKEYHRAFPKRGKKRAEPPYRRQRMIEDFQLFINGEVETLENTRKPLPGDEWIWVSTMPYARNAGHSSAKKNAEKGMKRIAWMVLAAKKAQAKFRKFVKITHEYVHIPSYLIREDKRENIRTGNTYVEDRRYPAIKMRIDDNVLTTGKLI